jgi:hypothetical protein
MAQIFINDAATTLAAPITAGALLAICVDASKFPVLTGINYFLVSLEYNGIKEIIKVVAPGKSGNNLIIDPSGRGWEGTTPLAFPIGSRVEGRITAGSFNTIISNSSIDTTTEAGTRLAQDTILQNSITAETSARSLADTTETNRALAAEALKAPLNSPALTGAPTSATTPVVGTSNTVLANTAFVHLVADPVSANLTTETSRATAAEATKAPLVGTGTSGTWPISVTGSSTSTTSLAGPHTSGSIASAVTAVTQVSTDNSTALATTAFVQTVAPISTVIVDGEVAIGDSAWSFTGTRPILLILQYGGGQGGNAFINITFRWGIGGITNTKVMFNAVVDYQTPFTAVHATVLIPSSSGILYAGIAQTNTLGGYGAPASMKVLALQL